MPCSSDYMQADGYELEISRVACMLDELDGKPWTREAWDGYHPAVYNKCSKHLGDQLVSKLCERLTTMDVSKCSLEIQMWWRDHLLADMARLAREEDEERHERERRAALEKLTPHERKLLGVKK